MTIDQELSILRRRCELLEAEIAAATLALSADPARVALRQLILRVRDLRFAEVRGVATKPGAWREALLEAMAALDEVQS